MSKRNQNHPSYAMLKTLKQLRKASRKGDLDTVNVIACAVIDVHLEAIQSATHFISEMTAMNVVLNTGSGSVIEEMLAEQINIAKSNMAMFEADR